ncbi:unnamed protein product, partial [Amoebophrya sp. A25]
IGTGYVRTDCTPTCGNGVKELFETCDVANTVGCDAQNCTTDPGYYCDATGVCKQAVCGDGNRDTDIGETCDDRNTVDGDGCSSTCQVERGYTCRRHAQFDADACRLFNAAPRGSCVATCGNGILESMEECDDGNLDDSDGCDRDCRIRTGFACTNRALPNNTVGNSTCNIVTCGDGKREGTEACDDGNTADLDGCSQTCVIEPGYACAGAYGMLSSCGSVCGDGYVVANETCDDANEVSNDGCDANCQVEPGFKCLLTERPTKCLPVCGDGVRFSSEECDDANTANSDGCSEFCRIELGWHCDTVSSSYSAQRVMPEGFDFGTGDTCKMTVCGDGLIEGQEECDDFNGFNYDGCSADCRIEPD